MPRESSISNDDTRSICSVCMGTGQVKDLSEDTNSSTLISCPFCGGYGRVPKRGGNNKKLRSYNLDQARKVKAQELSIQGRNLINE